MTAKKTAKSAKAGGSRKQAAAKSKTSSGLLSKLKGALAKKKPATAAAKPATRAANKTARPAVPKAKPAVAKSGSKSAHSTSTKPASKAPATAARAAPATSPRPARAPAPIKNVTKTAVKQSRTAPLNGNVTEDDLKAMSDDQYMNDVQLEFFRKRLLQMRQEVLQREMDVKERLHEREVFADPADRATAEEEHWLDLRLRERESLLLRKIDDALRRIEAKEYGYCEKTGDPIGIPRLLARPTATVCVDVKGQDERVEAQYRDR